MRSLGLYIHIPFCVKKCNYCDFYSLGCVANGGIERYIDALCSHIRDEGRKYENREVDTVFLGGGTPSLLSPSLIKKLFCAIRETVSLSEDCEISLEVNPGTLTKEKAEAYKSMGINRVSTGLQSVSDSELKVLGRIHTLDDFKYGYALLREAGIDNINIDVMYALPNQKTENFIKTLDTVVDFAPEHISAYCLKIEENTNFYKIKDTLALPDEDEQYKMYLFLCENLEKAGYLQYEISNFAKKGAECIHNLKYWLSYDYIGFGPSAHSFVDGVRYSYADSTDEYVEAIENGKLPAKIVEESPALSKNEKMDEYVMLRLRLASGVDTEEFEARFGISFDSRYEAIKKYEKSGHVYKKGNNYAFTPKGFFVSNYILSDILESI